MTPTLECTDDNQLVPGGDSDGLTTWGLIQILQMLFYSIVPPTPVTSVQGSGLGPLFSGLDARLMMPQSVVC